jgi:hypothetical protein
MFERIRSHFRAPDNRRLTPREFAEEVEHRRGTPEVIRELEESRRKYGHDVNPIQSPAVRETESTW